MTTQLIAIAVGRVWYYLESNYFLFGYFQQNKTPFPRRSSTKKRPLVVVEKSLVRSLWPMMNDVVALRAAIALLCIHTNGIIGNSNILVSGAVSSWTCSYFTPRPFLSYWPSSHCSLSSSSYHSSLIRHGPHYRPTLTQMAPNAKRCQVFTRKVLI